MDVRIWLIAFLAASAAYVGWRAWRGQSSPIALGVVVFPLIFLGYQEQRDRALIGRYSDAVSAVAGRPVTVRCQGAASSIVDVTNHLGSVQFGPDGPVDHTDVKRSVCKALASYISSDKRAPSADEITAVHVLSHEAHHLAAVSDEAEAECRAMQTDAQVARALGASVAQANNLARAYWIRFYPYMPKGYTTKECVSGGRFDMHPDDDGWPTAGDHYTGG